MIYGDLREALSSTIFYTASGLYKTFCTEL